MNDLDFAGPDMIRTFPYEGIPPHGKMLETLYGSATIDGHEGALVIKRNYGPEGVSPEQVLSAPDTHLGAVTVMFKREDGYDPRQPELVLGQVPAGRFAGQEPQGHGTGRARGQGYGRGLHRLPCRRAG